MTQNLTFKELTTGKKVSVPVDSVVYLTRTPNRKPDWSGPLSPDLKTKYARAVGAVNEDGYVYELFTAESDKALKAKFPEGEKFAAMKQVTDVEPGEYYEGASGNRYSTRTLHVRTGAVERAEQDWYEPFGYSIRNWVPSGVSLHFRESARHKLDERAVPASLARGGVIVKHSMDEAARRLGFVVGNRWQPRDAYAVPRREA